MIVGFVITSLNSSPLGGGGCRNALLMTDCAAAQYVASLCLFGYMRVRASSNVPQVEERMQLMQSAITLEGRINELRASLKIVSEACTQL